MPYSSFKEKYSALPGDWGEAQDLWGQKARNGNQNGLLEGRGLEAESEAVSFWHHLTLAGLISCPDVLSSGIPCFGAGAPSCPLGGGFTVEDSPDGLEGLWMILGQQREERGTGGSSDTDSSSISRSATRHRESNNGGYSGTRRRRHFRRTVCYRWRL